MFPNFKILVFFWRQFCSIASKKKLLLTYPSFFPHRSRNQEKKGREWAKKSLKLPSGKPKYLEIYLNWPQKMFNRKWSEEIAASFSFFSSSVPTFTNTLILRFISIIGTKYLILRLHISPQGEPLFPYLFIFTAQFFKMLLEVIYRFGMRFTRF